MTIKLTVNTDQEAFDAVVRHLKNLKGRAALGAFCVYLTADGRNCAIGAIMDNPHMASRGAVLDLIDDGTLDPGELNPHLLDNLQTAHDRQYHWDGDVFIGTKYLRQLAKSFGLSTAVLDEVFA